MEIKERVMTDLRESVARAVKSNQGLPAANSYDQAADGRWDTRPKSAPATLNSPRFCARPGVHARGGARSPSRDPLRKTDKTSEHRGSVSRTVDSVNPSAAFLSSAVDRLSPCEGGARETSERSWRSMHDGTHRNKATCCAEALLLGRQHRNFGNDDGLAKLDAGFSSTSESCIEANRSAGANARLEFLNCILGISANQPFRDHITSSGLSR